MQNLTTQVFDWLGSPSCWFVVGCLVFVLMTLSAVRLVLRIVERHSK